MTALLLLTGLLLLLANAIFVGAEFALVAARGSRVRELAGARNARARIVLASMRDLPRTLAATQLGITMASIGLGFTVEATVEASVVPVLEHVLPLPAALLQVAAAALALGIVVAAHTVLGEMVPKNLAVTTPERSALLLGPLVRPFAVAVRPAVLVVSGLANALLRALRVEPRSELAAAHGMEEIADMLRLAGREGVIDLPEHRLLERALRFAHMNVEAVMVPWRDVTTASVETSRAEAERLLMATNHSRLPVLRDGEVLGFANILDLQRPTTELPLQAVLRVPRSRRLVEVFEELRQTSGRLAIVMGDTGKPIGMVTLEDLLQELLGPTEAVLAPQPPPRPSPGTGEGGWA